MVFRWLWPFPVSFLSNTFALEYLYYIRGVCATFAGKQIYAATYKSCNCSCHSCCYQFGCHWGLLLLLLYTPHAAGSWRQIVYAKSSEKSLQFASTEHLNLIKCPGGRKTRGRTADLEIVGLHADKSQLGNTWMQQ